jgi:hypothetical protein
MKNAQVDFEQPQQANVTPDSTLEAKAWCEKS